MPILREWLDDMPQQFQGKARIQILISAFARQLDELNKVFDEINSKTTLETAVGQNLDYVGNIATMTRKDAHVVLRKGYNAEITDDVYRKVILWKLIKNTCDCTYEDIMGSMSLLWNTDNIQYIEDPSRPATILIKMPTLWIDDMDPIVGRILSIKPGGVGLIYALGYVVEANISGLEQVDIPKVVMRTALSFWKLTVLDGTWLLDGSNKLNAVLQPLDGRMVFRGIDFFTKENIIPSMRVLSQIAAAEQIIPSTVFRMEIPFWKMNLIDGTWLLDGTKILSAVRQQIGVKNVIRTKTSEIREEISDAEVFLRRNYWCLGGQQTLDGSKRLNAEISKEVLE